LLAALAALAVALAAGTVHQARLYRSPDDLAAATGRIAPQARYIGEIWAFKTYLWRHDFGALATSPGVGLNFMFDAITASIALDGPDPLAHNRQIADRALESMAQTPGGSDWRRIDFEALVAARAADDGRFAQAAAHVARCEGHPLLREGGLVVLAIRADLRARRAAYLAGRRYDHPERQLVWETVLR
jgi:hypothetical protein